MSKTFKHDSFLPESTNADQLCHQVAGNLPIIGYHNHIKVGNNSFENIFQLWLRGDLYKHRAMMIFGCLMVMHLLILRCLKK
jgi:glucuronate isomerase